ncbi:MAG: hypothetical protein NTY84_01260 [Verrucomicrobia bacterium]|nr:hypothetical protein [Verrucomicrobiota bacterium]
MKTHPLDRLLKSAATAYPPAAAAPALEPVLEHRVLAAMRRARSEAEGINLLAVLRWGVAFAGCAALCAILLSVSDPANSLIDEAFVVPEPETYLALQ